MLGIWTWGDRMIGADETTELWRPRYSRICFKSRLLCPHSSKKDIIMQKADLAQKIFFTVLEVSHVFREVHRAEDPRHRQGWGGQDRERHEEGLSKKSFFNGQIPASFYLFHSFQKHILHCKSVGFSGIRTRIVRIEGDHADHLTTTTAAPIHFAIGWLKQHLRKLLLSTY